MASTYPSPASFNTPIVGNVGTFSVAIVPQNLARDALYMFNPGPATIWLCPGVGTDQLPLAASVGGVGSIPVPPGNTFFAEGFTGSINAIADSGTGNVLTVWECYQHSRFEVEEMANFSIIPGQIPGVTNGSDALPGNVGEIISASTPNSSIPLTTAVTVNMSSIVLSPGDWDVFCSGAFTIAPTTAASSIAVSISLVSATVDAVSTVQINYAGTVFGSLVVNNLISGPRRVSVSVNTTVYAVLIATFSVSTMSVGGFLRARRMR
jgi:hypothetical protein